MTCMKITESQNGQIYPEDTFSHGAAQVFLILVYKNIYLTSRKNKVCFSIANTLFYMSY